MKKFLAFILTVFYLASTSGATVHMHFCMGKMVEKSFWQNDDKKCGKCGMEKSERGDNGCCKDEHKQFKIDNEHQVNLPSFPLLNLDAVISPLYIENPHYFVFSSIAEELPGINAPPRTGNMPIYIRNSVFRI